MMSDSRKYNACNNIKLLHVAMINIGDFCINHGYDFRFEFLNNKHSFNESFTITVTDNETNFHFRYTLSDIGFIDIAHCNAYIFNIVMHIQDAIEEERRKVKARDLELS
jgi:hypothetical protein|nr:MAG TPA: hypothetical protein [Caudoviricetes sp.]